MSVSGVVHVCVYLCARLGAYKRERDCEKEREKGCGQTDALAGGQINTME